LPTEIVEELSHLTQALKVKELARGGGRRDNRRVGGVVGRAEGYGGMAAIRQTHDDVWAFTVTNADDRQ
jgi:hypothetical protein